MNDSTHFIGDSYDSREQVIYECSEWLLHGHSRCSVTVLPDESEGLSHTAIKKQTIQWIRSGTEERQHFLWQCSLVDSLNMHS